MKLVLLSDLHLVSFDSLRTRDFFTKRGLAWLNLRFNRKDAASGEKIARLAIQQIKAIEPDHILVTGDFSNMALASEFELARDVLAPIWDPNRLSVVPGNHDYYAMDSVRAGLFEHYFRDLVWGPSGGGAYPGIKTISSGVALLLFRSTHYLPGVLSFGWISGAQIKRARAVLQTLRPDFTIAAFHHNLHKRRPMIELTGKMLRREKLKTSLLNMGVDMVLTGHDHHHLEYIIQNDSRKIQVIGSGSTTLTASRHLPNFTVIDLDRSDPKKTLKIKVLSYDPSAGDFRESLSSS